MYIKGFSNRIWPRERRISSFVDDLENEAHISLHAALRFYMFADVIVFALK